MPGSVPRPGRPTIPLRDEMQGRPGLAFLLDGADAAERAARCRELRALALVYLGRAHPCTTALADPALSARALLELAAVPRRGRALARRFCAGVSPPRTRPSRLLYASLGIGGGPGGGP